MKRKKGKTKRKYLLYVEKSIDALVNSVDSINRAQGSYNVEQSLILLTNAWELFAKGILLRRHESIKDLGTGWSISAEDSVSKLVSLGLLTEIQGQHIQQVISIRNTAIHSVLPSIPTEIIFHLEYYSVKFFKELLAKTFPVYRHKLSRNFLSISFDSFTTYADKVQSLVSKARRKSNLERELVWLLERGIRFKGGKYIPQDQFEKEIKKLNSKQKLLPHLHISDFIKQAEMVVVVPVQAPRGFTADITLRKGGGALSSALPVMIKKTDIETDYPYLTRELADKVSKSTTFVAFTIKKMGWKGDPAYHQSVRSSKSGEIQRYSQKTLDSLKDLVTKNPNYSPFRQNMAT